MAVTKSILDSVKKLLQLPEDYTPFDTDVIMHINSVFSTLHQLGIGPPEGFQIEDKEVEWDTYLANDPRLNFVKTYVFMKVRLTFDPPTTSYALTALKEQISELEWRINVQREEEKWTAERLLQIQQLGL